MNIHQTILTTIVIVGFYLTLKLLKKMANELAEVKQDLVETKALVTKVAADVTLLHTKIDAAGEQPTAEEWAEIKTLSSDIKESLAAVDAQTPEEGTGEGGEGTEG